MLKTVILLVVVGGVMCLPPSNSKPDKAVAPNEARIDGISPKLQSSFVMSAKKAQEAPKSTDTNVQVKSTSNKQRESIVIDGRSNTIGLTIAGYLGGLIKEPFATIIEIIINVLSPSNPAEDIDYFELIKENVQQVVGQYINEHNMNQIEVYKDDLAVLMQRYNEAPEESQTYPDKNTMANSLSTAIIANRFLIEAVEWPQSMILHYTDIASIHIVVLKDVAETYTSEAEKPSLWWRDLDQQLEHYISYGRALQAQVVDWRNDMVECTYEEGVDGWCRKKVLPRTCYDVWTIRDLVAEYEDKCRQVHGSNECDDHCQAYQVSMNQEVSAWVWEYMGKALVEWEKLKELSSVMAEIAE